MWRCLVIAALFIFSGIAHFTALLELIRHRKRQEFEAWRAIELQRQAIARASRRVLV